jgi:peptidoglycan hydrolase-like protein with peptidoglycan-binding domain
MELKKGSKGNSVREIQTKLSALGFSTKGVDGIFGSNTEIAVKNYQSANGFDVTGIVDFNTLQHINATYEKSLTNPKKLNPIVENIKMYLKDPKNYDRYNFSSWCCWFFNL